MSSPARRFLHRNPCPRSRRVRLLLERLEERTCPSNTYSYPVIAESGQAGISAIREFPSINDSGEVAFIGALSAGGDAVFAGNVSSPLTVTNLSGTGSANTTYLASAQINDAGNVLATEQQTNPNFDSLRLWDVNNPGSSQSLAGSGVAGTAIFTFATLANDANPTTGDGIAFGALTSPGATPTLQMPNPPLGFGTLLSGYTGAGVGLQPMMADNNEVVFQRGNGATYPILLNEGPGINITIANSADFTTVNAVPGLGAAPGISPDGQVVAFYGNLTIQGAAALNSAQPTITALTPGPGIFASVQTASHGRVIVRVAGLDGSGISDVADFTDDANDRVAVNDIQQNAITGDSSFTVVFMGQDANGNDGIYVNRVDLFGDPSDPTGFRPNIDTLVAQVGDSLSGVSASDPITALHIDDSINSAGQVAFWVSTASGANAIAVADPIPVMAVAPLSQLNPAWAGLTYAYGAPYDGTDEPETIGESGCTMTALAMALNYAGGPSMQPVVTPFGASSSYTPASLNWLLTGTAGYTEDGWVQYWDATDIAAKAAGVPGLRFNTTYLGNSSTAALTEILQEFQVPVLVRVNGNSHTVVVTGQSDGQFTVVNPGSLINPYTTLAQFPGTFYITGFITDPTDISNLTFVVEAAGGGADLTVTNPLGQQTGIDAGGETVDDIPQSGTFAQPAEDDVTGVPPYTDQFVSIAQPQAGAYTVSVTGATAEPFTVYADPIATDGTVLSQTTFTGTVTPGSPLTFNLTYNPQPPPSPPVVTTSPQSQVVQAGDSVSFVAAASGEPAPTVQWQVSTDGGSTFTNLAGATSATLTLTAASAQNYNEYRAVFTNPSGSAATSAAILTVSAKPSGLVISSSTGVFPQFNLIEPSNSGASGDFGAQILTLSTGNILVTDPGGVGAVYLFNGETGALISALTGTGADVTLTALTNGNYVVFSTAFPGGAATWGSGTTGASGTVSAANSLVGVTQGAGQFTTSNYISITPLTNGNYVVDSSEWGGGLGAVTWANGAIATSSTVSASNSLVGSGGFDEVGSGQYYGRGGVIALTNGNYVVDSPDWGTQAHAGALGAVTWGNGTIGVNGPVSASNSLVGSTPGDAVGQSQGDNFSVTALTNGNYVVDSPNWRGLKGAVTWGNGTVGVDGPVSAANSLVGSNPYDEVGSSQYYSLNGVIALTNGNYVVDSPNWNGDEGAATWGSGTAGISGIISAANSLVGNDAGDFVGGNYVAGGEGGLGGVVALTNGNYVVGSPRWNGSVGAVTWGNGTVGVDGLVSAANSLVGSNLGDTVGGGSQYATGGEKEAGVVALANGNYVVDSPSWSTNLSAVSGSLGAVTWGDGFTGTSGTVSSANSLVGSFPGDAVGLDGVTALANGNYVVASPNWNTQGAATWGNGTTGTVGTISAANSLVGSTTGDWTSEGVTALANGNYVVLNPSWNGGAGAATWGNGAAGTDGTVSATNSLNNFPDLNISNGVFAVTTLPNGNYVVINAPGTNVTDGATQPEATWVDGTTGTTLDGQNTPDGQNSLYGDGGGIRGIQPISSGSAFVYTFDNYPNDGIVTVAFTDPNLLTYAFAQGQTITVTPDFITRSLDAGTNVTVQSNEDITVSSPIVVTPTGSPGSLTLDAGRSILLNAGINTAGGNMFLTANDTAADGVVDGERDPGNAVITMASGVTLNTGSGALSVDLKHSTDKTNNGSGVVTLLGVSAAATTLSSASTLGITINGTTPGDGVASGSYTQVNATGPISLTGASLSITHGTTTPAGSTFTIVQTTGGVSGTFNGLSEGATVTAADGSRFTISYQANGGKDVVLTQVGAVVPTKPAITTQPASQTIVAGNRTTFTAAASGIPAPTIQWQVSTDGGRTFGNIKGATATGLSFPAQLDQNGTEYQAVFTNTVGTATTQVVTLTVTAPPTITTQPNAQQRNAGQMATFTASAGGLPTPAVQWQVSTNGGKSFANLAGATSTTLTFAAQKSQNGNQYRAVFTNAVGQAATNAVTLTVTFAPQIAAQPTSKTVAVNQTSTFTATASGNPAPSVQWQVRPKGATVFRNLSGATATTLTLSSVPLSDSGNQYRAVFTNSLGNATTNAVTLTVDVPPAITRQPNAQHRNAGQMATFTASAGGLPTPAVQWQVSTNGGKSFANLAGATSTTLTFAAQKSQNGNQYRAVFTNAVGQAATNAVTLTVTFAPQIAAQPTSKTVAVNQTSTFTATASGNPAPSSVQWQVKPKGATAFRNMNGATATTLTLSSVPLSESGNQYRAVFTNSLGSVTTKVVTLTVDVPPTAITQPKDQDVNAGQKVTFTASADGTPAPRVQWQVSTDGGTTFSNLAGATSATLTFTATTGKNGYRYRAVFTNAIAQVTSGDAVLEVS